MVIFTFKPQEISPILVGKSLVSVVFPMFWLGTVSQDILKTSENSSSYSEAYQFQNHYVHRWHAVNGTDNRSSEDGERQIDISLITGELGYKSKENMYKISNF